MQTNGQSRAVSARRQTGATRPGSVVALLILLTLVSSASAANLSLPLDGYYRTGKYMPVRFEASPTELRLSADGAVTTVVQNPAGGIAPFLVVQSPIRNSPFSQSLHELQPDEKLVGYAIDAPGVAEKMFPGDHVIPLRLDPTNPLPGMGMCWQSLDAVVLDLKQFQELNDWKTLLAGGVTFVVRNPESPDALSWPWQEDGGYWVLRASAPPPAMPSDETYAPMAGWLPANFLLRRTVIVAGVVVVILILAVSLWRMPGVTFSLAAVAISIFLVGAIRGLIRFAPSTDDYYGVIFVKGEYTRDDFWDYTRVGDSGEGSEDLFGLEFPMLAQHGGPEDVRLICDRRGSPEKFDYRLSAGAYMAVLMVDVAPVGHPNLSTKITSPLRRLLTTHYPGASVLGEDPRVEPPNLLLGTSWPDLYLANSDAIPK
jgi:hypothetical protein